MSYAAAVDHLHGLTQELAAVAPRRKFDLEHMRVLARALGDPQRQFRSILIAGTNGKGSTAATLAGILAAAGVRVLLFIVNKPFKFDFGDGYGIQNPFGYVYASFFQDSAIPAAMYTDAISLQSPDTAEESFRIILPSEKALLASKINRHPIGDENCKDLY